MCCEWYKNCVKKDMWQAGQMKKIIKKLHFAAKTFLMTIKGKKWDHFTDATAGAAGKGMAV